MSQETKSETHVKVPLQELRLRPGTEMMILDSKNKMLPHKAQFIAIFAGRSILVSVLVDDINKIALNEGETYLFKGFTGIYDFSFTASVLKVDKSQFNARLSCPETVSIIIVRSNLRVRLAMATSAVKDSNTSAIVINDLSAGGAGFNSAAPVGAVGERIQISLPIEFEKKKVVLNLTSEIRHISETGQGLKTGVEFVDISQQDKLMLHFFVHNMFEAGAAV